jgi:NAD(P)-dependent dehydrogenase (short-subunit alcohol dehydrogenase family)
MGEAVRPVALVTGAAGGVGGAVVGLLALKGYDIVATDLDEAVRGLESSDDGGNTRTVLADVSSAESARTAVDVARTEFGRLDLLVNNAALFLRAAIEETTDEDYDRLLAVNVRGAFVHAREAIPLLKQSKGSIINVSSISGLIGNPNQSIYSITKGALIQFTRALAIELAPSGVRVNAVAPGTIDTEFVARAGAVLSDPRAQADILRRHPIGRIMTAADVAEAICFLASPSASGITGTILSVDGGYVAQ